MMYMKMSIMGLYNYDPTIFDDFYLPDSLDKDAIINQIVLRCADLEVLYPNPDVMKIAIKSWSKLRLSSWDKMAKALDAEYNVIHNYDRNEEYKDTVSEKGSSEGMVQNNGSDTSNQYVSGYNTPEGLTNSSKNEVTYGGGNTTTGNVSSDKSIEHSAHMYGNIGVTTSQQMIESELELRKKDINNIIIDEFRYEFCLLIY